MTNQSSVLVLDDGELENVYQMLRQLGTDVVRLKGADIGRTVPAPRDLLISAGRRTLQEMPELVRSEDAPNLPIWVCVHNQDFLPLRERLCEMGVHYLLQNALDEQSRRRFLIQLLRKGAEQRDGLRLHLGGDIRYRTDTATQPGRLVELSLAGCRILTQESFDPGTLRSPEDLGRVLKDMLSSPNLCSRAWTWEQYDWSVRTNTLTPPGGDAAVVRVKETGKALPLSRTMHQIGG